MENDVKIAYQNIIMATTEEYKNYLAQFKAKVALKAVRGKLKINRIARQFSVHPALDFQPEKTFFRFAYLLFKQIQMICLISLEKVWKIYHLLKLRRNISRQ